ncbi:MAG: Na+/H+ antiporter subunit E [Arenicellales bacterium]
MTRRAPRLIPLLAVLAAFWLMLSGHLTAPLLTLGVLSCLFVAWLTLRAGIIGRDSILSQIRWGRWCRYQLWLVVQIARSAVGVSARILDPRLPVSPVVDRVPVELSDLGKVIYANSITLTPGTVAINLGDSEIIVHSLTREGAEQLKQGDMHRRVREVLGQP